jgi:hypothetical protein
MWCTLLCCHCKAVLLYMPDHYCRFRLRRPALQAGWQDGILPVFGSNMSRCHALLALDYELTSSYVGMAVLGTHQCMQHSRPVCRWVLVLVAIL